MAKRKGVRCVGILTSGGDCPGLNAAIRAVGKALMGEYGIEVIGILDGFRGLVENRTRMFTSDDLSGILTLGGTILRTSRDKPHRFPVGDGQVVDMTNVAIANYDRMHLDCLVCLGGGGTQKNALHLMKAGGISVLTLPKTIDNDVWGTDVSFGYDTALGIATEAVDRLHTTAESHHRIMVVETMGHNTGWLALGAGLAGGADVILVPEIPYDLEVVAESIVARNRRGRRFSIVAVAEGAISKEEANALTTDSPKGSKARKKTAPTPDHAASRELSGSIGSRVAERLQEITGIEARMTALGHLQRGGTPSAADRMLATRLGSCAAMRLARGEYGIMIAARGECCEPLPLEEVAGKKKCVPLDHPLVTSARLVGTCLGDG